MPDFKGDFRPLIPILYLKKSSIHIWVEKAKKGEEKSVKVEIGVEFRERFRFSDFKNEKREKFRSGNDDFDLSTSRRKKVGGKKIRK